MTPRRKRWLTTCVTALVLGCGPQPVPPPAAPESAAPVPANSGVLAPSASASSDHGGAAVPVTAADPSWGHPEAPVTLVEFADFECPFSARVQPTLLVLRERYGPERLRIVWKHHPLPFHKAARPVHDAAAAVFSVGGSEAFFRFHDLAFANRASLGDDHRRRWAVEAGVDGAGFDRALASGKPAAKVEMDIATAQDLGSTGTPDFFINGVALNGARPFDKFTAIIDEQLAQAEQLVASGVAQREVYVTLTNRNFKKPVSRTGDGPAEDKSVWKIPVLPDDPAKGPADALVTIVEWGNFQCPFSKRALPTLERVLDTYPKDVRLVWKDNPLPFHVRARPSALLARYAFERRGHQAFWQVHDAIFASQPELEDDDLKRVAGGAGLDWKAVERLIGANRSKKIDESTALAADFAARGTPHFFVNGVRLSGAQPYEKFEALIEEQLALARKRVVEGVPRAKVYATIMKDAKSPDPPERKQIPAPDASSPFRGSATAKLVIQQFSDFQCPFCKRAEPTLAELEKEYPGELKIVWRHLPLEFHRYAALAAEAAQEAFEQEGNAGFFCYHEKLFEAQSTPEGLERENLELLAADCGIDVSRLRVALDARKHRRKVESDARIAKEAGIQGTPAFVINGYFVSGAQPIDVFRRVIERVKQDLKRGK